MVEASRRDLAVAKDRSDHSLYARTVALAYQQATSGNLTSAEDLLASLPETLRFQWEHVHGLCHAEIVQLEGMDTPARRLAMAFDGIHVVAASYRADNKLYRWDIANGQPTEMQSLPC
ncbi:MAG: hypothetical protein R3C05_09945 [Pirellulaceae bacterium]